MPIFWKSCHAIVIGYFQFISKSVWYTFCSHAKLFDKAFPSHTNLEVLYVLSRVMPAVSSLIKLFHSEPTHANLECYMFESYYAIVPTSLKYGIESFYLCTQVMPMILWKSCHAKQLSIHIKKYLVNLLQTCQANTVVQMFAICVESAHAELVSKFLAITRFVDLAPEIHMRSMYLCCTVKLGSRAMWPC